MIPELPISELVDRVLLELEKLKYSQRSIAQYRSFYRRFIVFMEKRKVPSYTEKIANDFLRKYYNFTLTDYANKTIPKNFRQPDRLMRVLDEFHGKRTISRRYQRKKPYRCSNEYLTILKSYEKDSQSRGYSQASIYSQWMRMQRFTQFLDEQHLAYSQISGSIISAYVCTLLKYSGKSVSAILVTLRSFLRFLYRTEYLSSDLSKEVPRLTHIYCSRIPSVWTALDVKKLLQAVDRGNPSGKRDYALLLLITRLGLRVGDVKNLQLSDLKWDSKTIQLVQQKTGKSMVYPMLDDIGWAIIDYLKNGRPSAQTSSNCLFVTHQAPFSAFGRHSCFNSIITKYTRLAGISIPRNTNQGMHALRHTLASTLLSHNTPLPVISEILGHMSSLSTNIYLKIDEKGLRRCALDPEEVFSYDNE
jgi:integrase/recombinase XerD